jgi:hypothetical protein
LEKTEEMDKFLEIYDLLKLNQEAMQNLNRSIMTNKIKAVSLPKKKTQGSDDFTDEFYQTFKELTSMLLKLFHKIEMKGMLPNLIYDAIITLKPKLDGTTKKTINQFP